MTTYTSKLKQDAIEFLKTNRLGVVATVNSERRPECATVHYFFDEDSWAIYLITRDSSRKYKNMIENPNVAFVVGTEMGRSTIQIEGMAHIIDKEETEEFIKKSHVLKLVDNMVGDKTDPFFDFTGSDFKIFHIRISWARMMFFDKATRREFFEQIIP